ncbi:Fe(3+) ABC transporter substrate-binding protein [Alkalinema pantanalense CENA528]|uniref:Fe(3+) ABC transporter substrate-binding protein n=1 Tax=Alkalinema pantanalense TaxID=1620705 RepID=UPI003D6F0D0E
MSITRRTFLATGAAFSAVAFEQILRSQAGQAKTDQVVNLYSARHYDTDRSIYESFTQKTGIKVNLIEADADKLISRIQSEGDKSPADVIITVDAGRLVRAQEAGILLPVKSKTLETVIPKELRDGAGHWFGMAKRARVLVYNREKVSGDELKGISYESLADSRWKGRIVTRSSGHVYNQSLIGSIIAAYDENKAEEWAKGIVANMARQPEGNDTAQIKAVAAGQGHITFVNQYYVARLFKSQKPEDKEIASKIRIAFPNQQGSGALGRGTHINISGAAVVKSSKNQEAAVKFLEHLASREAQEIFAKSNNEYPVLRGVEMDAVLKEFGSFKEDKLNAEIYGVNNGKALEIANRVGWK